MDLPKGTFKGLAKILTPLSFWIAAGWAAYPYMIEHIYASVDEVIDLEEIRIFSMFMTVACVIAGIALAIYGFTGKEASDAEIKSMNESKFLCPYCGSPLQPGSAQCGKCGNQMPQIRQ